MIKSVFFDLDDTLYDHTYASHAALSSIRDLYSGLHRFGIDELAHLNSKYLEELHLLVLKGILTTDEARTQRLKNIFKDAGNVLDDEDALDVTQNYRNGYLKNQRPVPGAIEFLRSLEHNYSVYIVTNNTAQEQLPKLDFLHIRDLEQSTIISEVVGSAKPHRQIFEIALAKASCNPHEAVMIGDSWNVDILGASQLGIKCLWLNRSGKTCPDPTIAKEFNSFEDNTSLLDLIT